MIPQPIAAPRDPDRTLLLRRRAARWGLLLGVVVLTGVGLVLLFLLTQATDARAFYERNYLRLLVVNLMVALVLMLTIGWGIWRLIVRLRRGKFGSRLLIKLAAIFGLVGVLPGVLIYTVSYQFVSRSIETWFDVKVEGALAAGVTLGRSTLDVLSAEAVAQARGAARQLREVPNGGAGVALDTVRDALGAADARLWAADGHAIATAGESRYIIVPTRPTPQALRSARVAQVFSQLEGIDELAAGVPNARAQVRVLALVPAPGLSLADEPRYLELVHVLPPALVESAIAVQEANREYQERALGRQGLRRMYIATLTLTMILAVFGAVLLAAVFGKQLAKPLLLLAEGVRQVAEGDLTPKPVLHTRDEMGGLTRSFAEMTRQLAEARTAVSRSMGELDDAREALQTILDNLTAGVIVLNRDGTVRSANPSATRILGAPLAARLGTRLDAQTDLGDFGVEVLAQFKLFDAARDEPGAADHWQRSFQRHGNEHLAAADDQTLLARGAALPDASWLLVFDDISEIISAQRSQAWGEVARRLAHEIKNPLTPIQLSAERLAHKLEGKLDAPEQRILHKSVTTIVDQVDAMKRLVNEFRDYARLPAAELVPLDLNALVADLLHLYGSAAERGPDGPGGADVPVLAELDPLCPPILGDAQQLRQVIHNLVQNAQDATQEHWQQTHDPALAVRVRTQWMEAARHVRLTVLDAGHGFPEGVLRRAFEPYVTTKVKGTGLGLAVVRKIAEEHGASIELTNRVTNGVTRGARVSLSFAIESRTNNAGPHGHAQAQGNI